MVMLSMSRLQSLALCCWFALSERNIYEESAAYLKDNAAKEGVVTLPSGLQYRVLQSGDESGSTPNETSKCEVHFSGSLVDGTEVDSSVKKGTPIKFKPKDALAGWKEALLNMREGDKWDLSIPADLAYGDKGGGSVIPAGSVLRLEVELLKVFPEQDENLIKDTINNLGERPLTALLLPLTFYFLLRSKGVDPLKNFLYMTGIKKRPPVLDIKDASKAEDNKTVFFDVQIGDGKDKKQIQLQLFAHHFPKTTERFIQLCTAESAPSYKGSEFCRAIPDLMVQAGKLEGVEKSDTEQTHCITHDREGLLSMSASDDQCASQFMVSLAAAPHWDSKHLCFGKVTKGMDVIKKIGKLGDKSSEKLKEKVTIVACGEIVAKPKNKSS